MSQENLGQLLKEFKPSPTAAIRPKMIVMSVFNSIFFILGAVGFVYKKNEAGIAFTLIGSLVLLFTLWGWYRLYSILPHLKLQLFEHGFTYQNAKAKFHATFDQVAEFYDYTRGQFVNGEFHPTMRSYQVVLKNGQRFKFNDDLADVGQAAHYLEQQVSSLLLPRALQDFEQGREVVFDYLALSKLGIKIKSSFLPWNEVAHMRYKQSQLIVKKKGGLLDWASFEYHVLPNQAMLQPILELTGVNIQGFD